VVTVVVFLSIKGMEEDIELNITESASCVLEENALSFSSWLVMGTFHKYAISQHDATWYLCGTTAQFDHQCY
jgi:hypothetical protein